MERESNAVGAAMPSISDAMEKIMAHPEILSMVASVLGGATANEKGNALIADAKESAAEETNEKEEVLESSESASVTTHSVSNGDFVAALTPLLSNLNAGKGGEKKADDPRSCLLRALKPYVSQGRKEAIDYMIRLSQISDLFKRLS